MLGRVAIGLVPFTLCALFLRHVARPGGEGNPRRTLTINRPGLGDAQKSLEYVIRTEKVRQEGAKRIPKAYFAFDDDAAYTWDDDAYKWAHLGWNGPYRSNFKNCSARCTPSPPSPLAFAISDSSSSFRCLAPSLPP